MTLALIIAFFLVALIHLYCCYFKIEIPRKATKPLLLIFLLALYVTLAGKINNLVIAALLLGLVGDVFLLSPKKPTAPQRPSNQAASLCPSFLSTDPFLPG